MSIDAFKAAERLKTRHYRSCISRAYYAAYAAITNELQKVPSITLDYAGNNPAHGKLPNYIQRGFPSLGHSSQLINDVEGAIKGLRRDRERSDYMAEDSIEEQDARECMRRAEQILRDLGLPI